MVFLDKRIVASGRFDPSALIPASTILASRACLSIVCLSAWSSVKNLIANYSTTTPCRDILLKRLAHAEGVLGHVAVCQMQTSDSNCLASCPIPSRSIPGGGALVAEQHQSNCRTSQFLLARKQVSHDVVRKRGLIRKLDGSGGD